MAEAINKNKLPTHWQIKKLEKVCEIKNGKNQKAVANPNGKYPIYGSAGIMGYADNYLCEAGTTIVGRKGTINKPIFVKTKFWNVDTAFGFSPFTEILNSKFLFFFCQSFNFHKLDKSTTIPSLAKTDLQKIEIPLPPLPEQQAIVTRIEELLSGLENGKQQLLTAQQQLKVYRQSLLKTAFEGKLTNKDVKEGELPKGWITEKLGLICEIKNGRNQKLVENPNGRYPIYGSAGKMGFADSYLCDAGSTIVGRKGTINKPLYVNEKFWNVDTAFGFMPNTDLITNRFLYFFCLSFNFAKLDKSTTIPSLAKTDLQKIDVVLPPLKEQELIVSELESKLTVCDKIDETISQSLQQAETLRQSILKKAFEGMLVNTEKLTVVNDLS